MAGRGEALQRRRLSRGLALHLLASTLVAVLLLLDPLFNGPSGLLPLSWFTTQPVSHGLQPCAWDYEGSWSIGLAHGSPDPRKLTLSPDPAISCATLAPKQPVSFVADPFLFIPAEEGPETSKGDTAWYAFYEMKNLQRYIGELGAAVSTDRGATWRHAGTALAEPFHLSYPLVLFDKDSQRYLMFAETSGAGDGAIRIYSTQQDSFPLGWRLLRRVQPPDPGWPAMRSWLQLGAAARCVLPPGAPRAAALSSRGDRGWLTRRCTDVHLHSTAHQTPSQPCWRAPAPLAAAERPAPAACPRPAQVRGHEPSALRRALVDLHVAHRHAWPAPAQVHAAPVHRGQPARRLGGAPSRGRGRACGRRRAAGAVGHRRGPPHSALRRAAICAGRHRLPLGAGLQPPLRRGGVPGPGLERRSVPKRGEPRAQPQLP
jgi:hypothetical protein